MKRIKRASWGRCLKCGVGQLETVKLFDRDKYIGWAIECNECGSQHKLHKEN